MNDSDDCCEYAHVHLLHPRYEVIKYLPSHGPPALAFSPSGRSHYSEQYVVRFWDKAGNDWVGNFRRGYGCYGVSAFEATDRVLVVSSGNLYLVDVETRQCILAEEAHISHIYTLPDANYVVLNGFFGPRGFAAFGPNGLLWVTPTPFGDFHDARRAAKLLWGRSEDGWDNDLEFVFNLEDGNLSVKEV